MTIATATPKSEMLAAPRSLTTRGALLSVKLPITSEKTETANATPARPRRMRARTDSRYAARAIVCTRCSMAAHLTT
jgi:hypothetical protein